MPFELHLNPRKIALFLGIVSLYLAGQSLINEYLLENVLSSETGELAVSLLNLFSVNAEETIPTWYATLLLFVAAMLLAFITLVKSRNKEPYARYWLGLTAIFLYLSMDEGAVIHEIFSDALQARFDTSGYLTFAWVLLFVPLVIIIALLYLRFLFHLPPPTRNLFIIAGLVYVGGAVVVEMVSANRWYVDGGVTFPYLTIATVEELMEMLGVVVFIFALLSYLAVTPATAVIGFASVPETAVAKKHAASWRRLAGAVVAVIVVANLALVSWAMARQSEPVASDPSASPFYRTVSERYAGQGVIILGINEVMEPGSLTAQPIAASLLTLFDDVMVVTLPSTRSSIAFASHDLPFDQEMLAEIVRQSGEEEFTILDITAVRAIADNAAAQP
ncbi:MAG: hypothetical protein KC441_08690 [Anaerolineales bacterium]|nr:hypothetical protein [Anaerolineales bacterium]